MIEIKGLEESINDNEVYEILTRHINKVLKSCIVFIGSFTDEGVKKGFLEKKPQRHLERGYAQVELLMIKNGKKQ